MSHLKENDPASRLINDFQFQCSVGGGGGDDLQSVITFHTSMLKFNNKYGNQADLIIQESPRSVDYVWLSDIQKQDRCKVIDTNHQYFLVFFITSDEQLLRRVKSSRSRLSWEFIRGQVFFLGLCFMI